MGSLLQGIDLEGFEFEDDDKNITLKAYVRNQSLSSQTQDEMLKVLQSLIEATSNAVSGLVASQ